MEDFNELIVAPKPILIDFYATWCEPCKWLEPVLEELNGLFNGSATILKIDIDQNSQLAKKYNVLSVPTLILFKAGQPVWRMNGFKYAGELYNQLKPFIVE